MGRTCTSASEARKARQRAITCRPLWRRRCVRVSRPGKSSKRSPVSWPTSIASTCGFPMLSLSRPRGCEGGGVVRRKHGQRSVFEVLLPDADKLWDPALRRIDEILEDDELVDLVADALGRRRPGSRKKGRPSTPAEVVLRMLVLKHLYDWSFDECEREVRGSLVYRAFCRIDCERVPDAKTLIRLSHLLDGDVLKKVLARLVDLARERK